MKQHTLCVSTTRHFYALGSLLVLALLTGFAGTGGSSEFGAIYTLLTGWLQGMLGRILAVTFMTVGLVSGVMRGSMMGLVLGIACGLGVYTAPTVINNIVTLVVP